MLEGSAQRVVYQKVGGYKTHRLFVVNTGLHPKETIRTRFITLFTSGLMFIEPGYAWDGASGPTIDTKSSIRASLVHDALYQLIRQGLLPLSERAAIDRLFHRILKEDKMWKWRAYAWYRAVRRLGWLAVRKPRKVYTAP